MLFFLLAIQDFRQQNIILPTTIHIIILTTNDNLLVSVSLLESKAEAKGLLEAVGALEAFFTELLPDFCSDPEGLFSLLEADDELFLAEEDALLEEAELFWAEEEDFFTDEADEADAELFLADEADEADAVF